MVATGRWRERLSLAGSIILGAVLLIAAIGKAMDPVLFVEQIRQEGLDVVLGANSVMLIALALEAGLGVALILGVRNFWTVIPASALVVFFLFLTGRNYWLVAQGLRDPESDCGCFGLLFDRTASEAFWQDLALLVVPMVMILLGGNWKSWKPRYAAMAVALLAAMATVFYAVAVEGLPPTPVGPPPTAIISGGEFGRTDDFVLYVDGIPMDGARVFHSEASLQFLIVIDDRREVYLLDAKRNTVGTLPRQVLGDSADGGLTLDSKTQPAEAATFEVGSLGLEFRIDDQLYEMRAR